MGLEGIRPGSPHYSLPELLHRVRVWGSRSVSAQWFCNAHFSKKIKRCSKAQHPISFALGTEYKIFQDIRVSFILKGFFLKKNFGVCLFVHMFTGMHVTVDTRGDQQRWS